jgi:hypothetical protein
MHVLFGIMQPILLSQHLSFQPLRAHAMQQRLLQSRCTAQRKEHTAKCMRQVQHKQRQPLSAAVAAVASMLHAAAAHAAAAAASSDAGGDAAAAAGRFEPQLNPGLLVVALFAAT